MSVRQSSTERWIDSSPFLEMATLRPTRTKRQSSWDRSGANRDFVVIEPGESDTLLDTEGPGCVHRLYIAPWIRHPHQLRDTVLRMYWDGETDPSVEVPLGDFFGIAHCKVRCFTSLMLCINPGGVVAVRGPAAGVIIAAGHPPGQALGRRGQPGEQRRARCWGGERGSLGAAKH